MNKSAIIQLLNDKHENLFKLLSTGADKYWDYSLSEKWNVGQIVLHLIQSENPLNKGLRTPKFILRYKFGKPNRPVRSYDEIVNRYQGKLKDVGQVVSPFSKELDMTKGNSEAYIKMIKDEHSKMIRNIEKKWSDNSLTKYLLPHPLMGRMHVSEMLLWTAYHTEHHALQIKERLDKASENNNS